jgi:hypothetical protein
MSCSSPISLVVRSHRGYPTEQNCYFTRRYLPCPYSIGSATGRPIALVRVAPFVCLLRAIRSQRVPDDPDLPTNITVPLQRAELRHHHTVSPEYDVDPAQWLGLFRAFSGVEKLHVTWGSVPDIARALQLVTAEIAVDMLPALRELKLDWLASRWREAVCSFIYARSLAGLPAVEFHQPDISV